MPTEEFFQHKDLRYQRDRKLRDIGKIVPPISDDPQDVRPEEVVFEEIQQVRDKAFELENAITSAIGALSIPVPEDHTEVRAAVRRQDASSGGNFITFYLYEAALSARTAAQRLTEQDARQAYSFFKPVSSRKLADQSLSKQTGMSPQDASYVNSQAGYMTTLQYLQSGLQALNTQLQTAEKLPPGVEVAPVLASLVSSIAFQIAYTANTIADIKKSLESFHGGKESERVTRILDEALKYDLSVLPTVPFLMQAKTPGDYEIIIGFAHTFLAHTDKVGYEPWCLLADTRAIRTDLDEDLAARNRYRELGGIRREMAMLMRKRAHTYSDAIDDMANALSDEELDLETLCSLSWLFNVPKSILLLMESIFLAYKAIRSIQLVAALNAGISGPFSLIWHLIQDVLLLISEATRRLLCWYQRDPDIWNLIYKCPPVAEMVDLTVTAIEEIERWLLNRFEDAIAFMRSAANDVQLKAQIVLELRRIRLAIMRIKYVFKAAENVEASIKQLKSIPDQAKTILGDAHAGLKLKIKKKVETGKKNLREFGKRTFDSNFLRDEIVAGRVPDVMPFVPLGPCGLLDRTSPDFSRLVARFDRTQAIAADFVDQTNNLVDNGKDLGSEVADQPRDIQERGFFPGGFVVPPGPPQP